MRYIISRGTLIAMALSVGLFFYYVDAHGKDANMLLFAGSILIGVIIVALTTR